MLGALASCSPIVDQRGHTQSQTDYSQIVEGQTTSEDVRALLGSPSTESTFGPKTWYYITSTRETRGMLAPEVIAQQVVMVRFHENDTVKSIDQVDGDAAKNVEYVEKTTPTEGRKLGVMEQLLGNFGKFNAPGRQIDPRNLGR